MKVTCCFEYSYMLFSAPLSNYGEAANNKISANGFGLGESGDFHHKC